MRASSTSRIGSSRRLGGLSNALTLAVIAASFGSSLSALADTYGNNGGTTLNLPSSWIDETDPANTGIGVPGASDIAAFDSNAALVSPTTFSLASPTSWLGLLIQNPGKAVTIDNGSNSLTLGASGIDMSAAAQSLTLNPSALVLAAAQTWNVNTGQTLTVTAPTSDGGIGYGLTKAGGGTVTFSAANTFGGNVTIDGGVVAVSFNASLKSQIFYNGLGSPGSLIMGGGQFTTNSITNVTSFQKFSSMIVSSGQSDIYQPGRQSGAHPGINLGAITRTVGATVDFEPQTYSSGSKTDGGTGIFTTTSNGASGILGGWATENGTDWAATTGSNGTNGGKHIYNLASYNTNTWSANTNNTDVTANFTATANATTGSVRFNAAGSYQLTTSGANVVATGGILVGTGVGANTPSIVPMDANSTLTSGNGSDLIVLNYSTGPFTIQTPIVNNGATPIALTKSGVGTLVLSGNNTFTGGLYLNQGVLQVANAGALNSSSPNPISFGNGVTIYGSPTSSSGTLTLNGNSITVSQLSTANVSAGTPVIQNAGGSSATLTVSGATVSTFNGTIQNGGINGTLGLTVAGGGNLTLSGANTYTGNTTITGASNLILSGAGSIAASNTINVDTGSTLAVGGVTGGFNVAGSQTLGGKGSITGVVNLPANAILSPGLSSVGTLTIDSLTLNAVSTINFNFGSGANSLVNVLNSDGLVINGANGTVNINLLQSGLPFSTTGTYDLFQYSGALGGNGTLPLVDANVPAGTTATFGTSGGFVTVTLAPSAVPVPTWNLTGGGSWNVAGDWNPSGVPNAQGQIAVLGSKITGPSTITLNGTQTVGSITFDNANSYTVSAGTGGSLVLDNGANSANLTCSQGNHTISANVALNSNLNASIAAGSVTISGAISEGSAGKTLTKSGAGTLILSGANTYTGGTSIGAGTVQVGSNTALGTGSVSFTGSATLQAGANVTLANDIAIGPAVTATVDTQANTLTLSGTISSADATASFSKIGSGTLVVTGTNTFTGNVNVNGGTLQLGDGVTNGSFANANITTVNSTLAINTVGAVTVPNTITGTGSVVQKGNNTVTLTGPNTFSGGLFINSGAVSLGAAQTTDPAGSGNITIADGGTLALPGFGHTPSPTFADVPNNVIIPNGANVTIEGQPRTNAGGFTGGVFGNGTINYVTQYVRGNISGDWSHFYGQVNLLPSIANGQTTLGGDFRINTGYFGGWNAAFNVAANVNVYTIVSGGTIEFGDLTGNGTLMTGDINIGTLKVGNTEIAGQTTTFTGTIGDATIGRATHFTKTGAGTLDLAGTNGFTGIVTVNAGTLTFAGSSSTPATTSGISVSANATLDLNNYNPVITPSTNVTSIGITGGGTIGSSSTTAPSTITYSPTVTSTFSGNIVDSIKSGNQTVALTVTAGSLILSGTNTYTGGTQIIAGTLQIGAAGTSGSIVGNVTNDSNLIFNRTDTYTCTAAISDAGNITQAGTGVLALANANNSFSGNVTINAGTLQMVPAVQFGNGAVPLTITAGKLDLNGTSTTIGSLSGTAAGVIDNVAAGGAATLTTGSLNAEETFAGAIQNTIGSVALVKNGAGNLTLSGGTSTYSGGTTLNSGGLYVTNTSGSATGSGPVTLNGGTLAGTGIIAGKIVPGSGPHAIRPGAASAIGTLTVGGLATNANTTLGFDLASPGGANDLLAVTGNVSLTGGTIAIDSLPITGASSLGFYKVMTYGGTLSGSPKSLTFTDNTGGNVLYTLDTSTPGVINIHKGFLGDVNDDGTVDAADLQAVLHNFGAQTTSWTAGNFDGARCIDLTDLAYVINNFGLTIPSTSISSQLPSAAPEPGSLALLLSSSVMLLRRKRACEV